MKVGGGVILAVKKSLASKPLHVPNLKSESVYCQITRKGKPPTIIGCVYRPPDNNTETTDFITNEITYLKSKFQKSIFWVGGDFNLPDIHWETLEIKGNRYLREINQKFTDTFNDTGLVQTVQAPTRGENTLDIFLTNCPDLIQSSTIVAGLGDHDAVHIASSLYLPRRKPVKRKIRLWKKADIDGLKRDMRKFANLFLSQHSPEGCVEQMWKQIQENLLTILDRNVPTKMSSSKIHQPWITTQTKRLLRQKQRWFQKAKHTGSSRAWNKYKDIKKHTQRACRKAHLDFVRDFVSDDREHKNLWTYIKGLRKDNTGISDLYLGETLVQNSEQKANMFNTFFTKVFSTPDPPPQEHVAPSSCAHQAKNGQQMNPIKVGRAGVLKLLLNIKPNKATGPDGIPGNLLKICAEEIADVYTLLFQASLDQGSLPSDWKKANIVPVFKKGDKGRVENYRPISLTSITSKILEHIIHSSIMDHLEKHSLLNKFQHGFRQKRSCTTQLITTVRDFTDCLNRKQQIDAVLLDFSKAFDKVDHEKLLTKLSSLGISDSLHLWIRSFLSGREQTVLVDGSSSSPAPVLSGVPQGTVLGPLLFLAYINDISKHLTPGTTIRLFADDSLLYRIVRTPEDSAILQRDLDTLQAWETDNKMEFHPDKCQVLRITNKHQPIQVPYTIHNVILSVVPSAKYLGVHIDSKISWNTQCSALCNKANSTLAFLQRNLYGCPPEVKEKCFNSLVRPVLEYGCSVWDPHKAGQIADLEKIQKRAARFVTGNHSRIPGNSRKNLDSLGCPPLSESRAKTKLNTLFQARLGLIDIPCDDFISPGRATRNNQSNFQIPQSSVDSHLHSFFPSSIRLWNNLPQHIKACDSVASFKHHINSISIKTSTQ